MSTSLCVFCIRSSWHETLGESVWGWHATKVQPNSKYCSSWLNAQITRMPVVVTSNTVHMTEAWQESNQPINRLDAQVWWCIVKIWEVCTTAPLQSFLWLAVTHNTLLCVTLWRPGASLEIDNSCVKPQKSTIGFPMLRYHWSHSDWI